MEEVQLKDKRFRSYISESKLLECSRIIGEQLNAHYADKNPLFIGVLNGCFHFMADLMKEVTIPCEINFTKVKSYDGTSSTGRIKTIMPLPPDIKGRHILFVEDIIDTGNTLKFLLDEAQKLEPASVEVISLLFKPDACHYDFPLKYVGLDIPNKFVVGYGLDYDGLGRNLRSIYVLKE